LLCRRQKLDIFLGMTNGAYKQTRPMIRFIHSALAVIFLGGVASASVTVTFAQVGSNVVATATGSFTSFSGLTLWADGTGYYYAAPLVNSSNAAISLGPQGVSNPGDFWQGYTNPDNFGLEGAPASVASSSTGSFNWHIDGLRLFLPQDVLGTPFDQVATWNDATFASLSLLPGTYSYVWAGDSLNIVVPAAVPEPGSNLALLALGAGGLTLRRRLKRSA
jgi:hypothetical protein